MNNANITIKPPALTRLERFADRLFPTFFIELPQPKPAGVNDVINLDLKKELTLVERLRILVCGRLRVTAMILTQHKVGQRLASGVVYAEPPRWTQRKAVKLQPLVLQE